jgi:hypothetical protein
MQKSVSGNQNSFDVHSRNRGHPFHRQRRLHEFACQQNPSAVGLDRT